jgi:hypothetical protein
VLAKTDDSYSAFGAGVLARKIESYWHERDARHVRAERYELPGFEGMWGVRSNLVAGLPPMETERVAA